MRCTWKWIIYHIKADKTRRLYLCEGKLYDLCRFYIKFSSTFSLRSGGSRYLEVYFREENPIFLGTKNVEKCQFFQNVSYFRQDRGGFFGFGKGIHPISSSPLPLDRPLISRKPISKTVFQCVTILEKINLEIEEFFKKGKSHFTLRSGNAIMWVLVMKVR